MNILNVPKLHITVIFIITQAYIYINNFIVIAQFDNYLFTNNKLKRHRSSLPGLSMQLKMVGLYSIFHIIPYNTWAYIVFNIYTIIIDLIGARMARAPLTWGAFDGALLTGGIGRRTMRVHG
jgi:hypothetical protein